MFVMLIHVRVKPENVEAFIDATRANHEGSVREPGCLRFDVVRSVSEPDRFLLYEWYVDEAAFEAHKTTQHYAVWREEVEGWMAEPRVPERFVGIFPEEPSGM
jgi:(4S)-4-hydroxy-5-phosphonooxypentane-2,3-dione isomerase